MTLQNDEVITINSNRFAITHTRLDIFDKADNGDLSLICSILFGGHIPYNINDTIHLTTKRFENHTYTVRETYIESIIQDDFTSTDLKNTVYHVVRLW